jgi:hypothetical protein
VRPRLLATLAQHGGVLSRAQALAAVSSHVIDDAVRAGALAVVFRGVYCAAGRQCDRDIRRRAALLTVHGSALSHTDALVVARMLVDDSVPDDRIHLTVGDETAHTGRRRGLQVHRRTAFDRSRALQLTTGHVIVDPHDAAVQSWPLLTDEVRRGLLIGAVRDRRLSTLKLRAMLASNTPGAAPIRRLHDLLDAGCQSELEMWGLTHVFDHPALPPSVAQRPVQLRDRTIYLDRAYDDVLVGVELDGAAYHFGRPQRERDMRRDAELAALGWLILRFSYWRLRSDPDGVRREIAAVIATREAQLGQAVGT